MQELFDPQPPPPRRLSLCSCTRSCILEVSSGGRPCVCSGWKRSRPEGHRDIATYEVLRIQTSLHLEVSIGIHKGHSGTTETAVTRYAMWTFSYHDTTGTVLISTGSHIPPAIHRSSHHPPSRHIAGHRSSTAHNVRYIAIATWEDCTMNKRLPTRVSTPLVRYKTHLPP